MAKVIVGKWGDDYPAIRLVGESSLDYQAEVYMEQITYGEMPEDEARANALLIAAAPDLLHAAIALVQKLHEYADDGLDVPGERFALEDAISKAEGK